MTIEMTMDDNDDDNDDDDDDDKFFYAFTSRDDDNPRRVNLFRSTAWTGETFTTHNNIEHRTEPLAIKLSADN